MNTIIRKQEIILNDQYDSIKTRIKQLDDFINLSIICSFNDEQKSLTFKTEKIHPEITGDKFTSLMFLFSNPHPLSVKAGLFLSEPRSRSFWQRLFECNHINPPKIIKKAIKNWTSSTPEILSDCLLKGEYDSKFRLFFDCLESLPTNQYRDLKKLFQTKTKKGRSLRQFVSQTPGLQNLIKTSQQNNIQTWIVFSVEPYRYLVGEKNIAKNAPNRICKALDVFLEDGDTLKFWDSLKDLKSKIQHGTDSITVYLSLIARCKNWKTKSGERYFTVMLNQIFHEISKENKKKAYNKAVEDGAAFRCGSGASS